MSSPVSSSGSSASAASSTTGASLNGGQPSENTPSLGKRPAFNELYEANTAPDRPPTSLLAMLAFGGGLLSLLAPISYKLVPLAVMAAVFSALIYWQLSQNPSRFSGLRWALAGLGLSVGALAWSLTSNNLTNQYLYRLAGDHAKIYLELVGRGRIYDALELHITKSARQIAGTDLEAFYQAKTGEEGERVRELMSSPGLREIERLGGLANWSFLGGLDVRPTSTKQVVTVQMANQLEPSRIATITMTRNFFNDAEGRRVAWWEIDHVTFENPKGRSNPAVR
jgi:hypothetical protein